MNVCGIPIATSAFVSARNVVKRPCGLTIVGIGVKRSRDVWPPDITGRIGSWGIDSIGTFGLAYGAFSKEDVVKGSVQTTKNTELEFAVYSQFQASKSNAMFNGKTIQPASIRVLPLIKS